MPRRADPVERAPVEAKEEAEAPRDVVVSSGARGEVAEVSKVEAASASSNPTRSAIFSLAASRLNIEEDQESGRMIYQFIDRSSGEVIKQLPAEELLSEARSANPAQKEGLFVDRSA